MSPPVTDMPTCSCVTAAPAMMTNTAQRTGRHRRDGSFPSGNNRTAKNKMKIVSTVRVWENHPVRRAAGSAPGAVASP